MDMIIKKKISTALMKRWVRHEPQISEAVLNLRMVIIYLIESKPTFEIIHTNTLLNITKFIHFFFCFFFTVKDYKRPLEITYVWLMLKLHL